MARAVCRSQILAGDVVLAPAALDRPPHRCTVVNIRGDTYRLRDRRKPANEEFP